jgi:hypothetical protein
VYTKSKSSELSPLRRKLLRFAKQFPPPLLVHIEIIVNKPVILSQIIEALEEKITNVYESEAERREKEVRRMRLKYELFARNEVNSRLSEINSFLDQRALEHDQHERDRDKVTDTIQKDMGQRLSESRDELLRIKQQMKGN